MKSYNSNSWVIIAVANLTAVFHTGVNENIDLFYQILLVIVKY